ncbi:MAG: ATP-binding protein [Alphaproteobacteria bacterium]|nr:ATP-binding protein [Alphaproteobacteria bacterium]
MTNNSSPHPFRLRMPGGKWVKRWMPRSLFGRTLLIIVTPTILALCVATFVFFDRHWYTVTHRLTHAVAGEIAMVVDMMRTSASPDARAEVVRLADKKLDLFVSYAPGGRLAKIKKRFPSPLRDMLEDALNERLSYPIAIDMRHAPEMVAIQVEAPDGVYTVLCPQRRIYTPTTEVFIGWMIGSSILLSVIALLFMRNQIRPIRRLATAAEAIGKGREVPWFKPEGAAEVRQAAAALQIMHDRLRRQITQRTAMLAGVSHDLRTPLTRMKLQLALMPETPEKQGFSSDIADMEGMVEAYLAFARGEETEPALPVDITELLDEIVSAARRHHPNVEWQAPESVQVMLRRDAMKRCLENLLSNALRYAKNARVSLSVRTNAVDVMIDDDGPGIPMGKREDVFRPFLRLDESRNPGTGGVGLGLTIARDIARFHGGDVVLENSPMGGIRARVWVPV